MNMFRFSLIVAFLSAGCSQRAASDEQLSLLLGNEGFMIIPNTISAQSIGSKILELTQQHPHIYSGVKDIMGLAAVGFLSYKFYEAGVVQKLMNILVSRNIIKKENVIKIKKAGIIALPVAGYLALRGLGFK